MEFILIGVWGFLFTREMTGEDDIFGFIQKSFWWFWEKVDPCSNYNKFTSWLAKPLFWCAMCHSGWFAIVYGIVSHQFSFWNIIISMFTSYVLSVIRDWLYTKGL